MSELETVDIHIGKRIRLLRNVRRMTQEKLAAALGITFQQVQKYERGSNRVGAARLYDIARIFQVPIGFFFDDANQLLKEGVFGLNEAQETFLFDEISSDVDYKENDLELLLRPETVELVRSYYQVTDIKTRRNILNLVQNILTEI